MDIIGNIGNEALVLIPALNIIGYGLKELPFVPNWMIPLILGILGAVSGLFLWGFTAQNALQGIIAAGTAVYGNQIVKQTVKRVRGEKDLTDK